MLENLCRKIFRAQNLHGEKKPCSNRDCTDEDVFATIKRLDEIAHEVEAEMRKN